MERAGSANRAPLGSAEPGRMVHEHILAVASQCFERNDLKRREIRTADDVEQLSRYVRDTFVSLIGGLPQEGSPLFAQTVGAIDRGTYKVEKILFSSLPGFLVTANLYLPKGRSWPVPGILVPCGHSANGKAYDEYQQLCAGLAQKGYAVLTYDPLGQGERSLYLDPASGASRIGIGVTEHDYAGAQSLLVGANLAAYMIWDGINALDYLSSRDEVDENALGCTGCSGGGTLTTYLMVVDPRIKVAVPVCYITSRKSWLETGLFADAEQVQEGVIGMGLDHAELCASFAPRPLLIGAAQRDFFPIEGTRETYEETRRLYRILGAEDHVSLVVDDSDHRYSPGLRRAAYRWFNRWFGRPEEGDEYPPFSPLPETDLWCADEGQVHTHHSRSVFSFTREMAQSLPPEAAPPGCVRDAKIFQHDTRLLLRDLISLPAASSLPPAVGGGSAVSPVGRTLPTVAVGASAVSPVGLARSTVAVGPRVETGAPDLERRTERIVFESEPGILVPTLVCHPRSASSPSPAIIYVHEEGKDHEADEGELIQTLVEEGYMVFAPDVRGVGETRSDDAVGQSYPRMGVEGHHFYAYGMLGESLLGRRVFDVLRLLDLIGLREDVDQNRISIAGAGMGGLLALFAGALDLRISAVACEGMPLSYKSIATTEYYCHHPRLFIPGVLRVCDLPQIAAAIAPRQLALTGLLDGEGRATSAGETERTYSFTMAVFEVFGAADRLAISGM